MQTLGSTSVPALLKYLRHAERLGLDIAPPWPPPASRPTSSTTIASACRAKPTSACSAYFCEHSGDPLFGLHSARFVQPGSWACSATSR